MTPDPTLIKQVARALQNADLHDGDEGNHYRLFDLLGFSGENKSAMITRQLAEVAIATFQGSEGIGETDVHNRSDAQAGRSGPQGDVSGRHTGVVERRGAGARRDDRTALRSGGEARRGVASDKATNHKDRGAKLGSATLPSEAMIAAGVEALEDTSPDTSEAFVTMIFTAMLRAITPTAPDQQRGAPASPSGCQPSASDADASSRSGIPNAVPEVALMLLSGRGNDPRFYRPIEGWL